MIMGLRVVYRWGVLVAAWLLVASCTSGHAPSDGGSRVTGLPAPGVDHGTLWLLAGSTPTSANVFRVRLANGRVEQVTRNAEGRGISWLSASPRGIVVADGSRGTDRIGVLNPRDGRITPLDTGDERTTTWYTPAISPDGAVAFARAVWPGISQNGPPPPEPTPKSAAPRPRDPPTWELVVSEPGRQTLAVVYRARPTLAAPVWGTGGALAFIESPGMQGRDVQPSVRVLDRDRQPSAAYPLPLSHASSLAWSSNDGTPLAATDGTGSTVLLNVRDGTTRVLPAGWVGLCWSPSGDRLLVGQGARLGLVSVTRPHEVAELGRFDRGQVYQCGWVDEE